MADDMPVNSKCSWIPLLLSFSHQVTKSKVTQVSSEKEWPRHVRIEFSAKGSDDEGWVDEQRRGYAGYFCL